MKFQELDLKQELQNAVVKAGYTEATPIQEKTMPVILEGRDLIACAQTGTGKTAAFALPILEKLDNGEVRKLRSLVLTPTRELAVQIFENFKKYGRYLPLRASCIYGGAKQKPQMEALRRGCDILVATPGRLMDYMNLGLVSLKGIEIFVLDEADRMLDMGFINDVRKIAGSMNTDRQTLMFSATMPKEIEQLGRELLRNPADVRVAPQSTAADTVDQKICFVGHSDKLKVLAEILKQEEVTRTIIFTRTKHGADRVARNLTRSGIAAKAIHGDKTQGQRQSTLEGYKAGHFHVLVATDVASRGLDIPEVSHVINFNLPQEPEAYIHRIGRTGRAGESGTAITLCEEDEMDLLKEVEKILKREVPEMKTEYSIVLRGKKNNTSSTAGDRGRKGGKTSGKIRRSGERQNNVADPARKRENLSRRTEDHRRSQTAEGGEKSKNRKETPGLAVAAKRRREQRPPMMPVSRSRSRISGRGGYTSFGYGGFTGDKGGKNAEKVKTGGRRGRSSSSQKGSAPRNRRTTAS